MEKGKTAAGSKQRGCLFIFLIFVGCLWIVNTQQMWDFWKAALESRRKSCCANHMDWCYMLNLFAKSFYLFVVSVTATVMWSVCKNVRLSGSRLLVKPTRVLRNTLPFRKDGVTLFPVVHVALYEKQILGLMFQKQGTNCLSNILKIAQLVKTHTLNLFIIWKLTLSSDKH